MSRLALKPFLTYVPGHSGGRAHFRGGDDFIIPVDEVSDPVLLHAVLDLFSFHPEPLTPQEVAHRLNRQFERSAVFQLIDLLCAGNILWSPPETTEPSFLWRYLSRFSTDVVELGGRLKNTAVQLWGEGEGADELDRAFSSHFFAVTRQSQPLDTAPQIMVALGGFDTESMFEEINRHCLAQQIPWIAVQRSGPDQAIVGPVFIPEETACYTCYRLRLASNRENIDEYYNFRRLAAIRQLSGFWHPSQAQMVAQAVALECVRFVLETEPAKLIGAARFWDLYSGDTTVETVLKLPDCPDCGGSSKR